MTIGYLILAHQYPQQLKRLILSLWNTNGQFFIHVDQSVNSPDFQSVFDQNMSKRIFFVPQTESAWGSFGLVKATLNGLNYIVKNKLADYIILMSGQDYPIKNSSFLSSYFNLNNNKIFISYSLIPKKEWHLGGTKRFPFYSKISKHINLYGGSQWWSMPSNYVSLIIDFLKYNKGFEEYFNIVRIPDESFFQTVILNIPEKEIQKNIINDNLRFIKWVGESPKIFDFSDFNEIKTSKKLFARKFDYNHDYTIISQIDNLNAQGN